MVFGGVSRPRGVEPAELDEFRSSLLKSEHDLAEIFGRRFFFGCEADDAMNYTAFNRAANKFGARLKAIFSSDIGHWDVPDIGAVLHQAHQQVDNGLMTDEDFRDFVFTNPVTFQTRLNPDFFKGTRVEGAVDRLLAGYIGATHGIAAARQARRYLQKEGGFSDPRIAAEMISGSHLFSVLKGLHKAPRPVFSGQRTGDIFVGDVDVLVSPMCWGLPHDHCLDHGIPIVFVEENKTTVPYSVKALNYGTVVGNYLEAAGLLIAMREGISPDSLRRPLKHAQVLA